MRRLFAIVFVLWSTVSYGGQPSNPVLTYLDDHQISYIAKVEKSTLVVYIVKGSVNLDELADLANVVDVRVEIRDHLAVK